MKHFFTAILAFVLITGCSNNYGNKLTKDYLEVYYKDGISKEMAEKTLEFLLPEWRDDGEKTKTKSIQLSKAGDTIVFKAVSIMDVMNQMDESVFYDMGNELSEKLYSNAPVNVVLTDEKFSPLRHYVFRKKAPAGKEEKVTAGNVEVYHQDGVTTAEANQLAAYLDDLDGAGGTNRKTVKIGKEADGSFKLMIVYDAEYAKSVPDEEFLRLAASVSDGVLGGAPVQLVLTDEYYKPFKTLSYQPGAVPAETPAQ